MVALPTITVIGTAITLFFFMLISIHLGIRVSQNSEQQLCILLCYGFSLGFQRCYAILISTTWRRERWRLWIVLNSWIQVGLNNWLWSDSTLLIDLASKTCVHHHEGFFYFLFFILLL
jgi:hypothetical protein